MSQTVERALRILGEIANGPQSIDEVANSMGVHPSTALRTLQVLEEARFVVRDDRHIFRLGSGLIALASEALEGIDLRGIAEPHLDALSQDVGRTIHLAALEGERIIYADKRESLNPVRMWSRIGSMAPIHCTAVAKAVVAFLPDFDRTRLVENAEYQVYTEHTIPDSDTYLEELERVATQGYATDHLEHEPFVNCLAAPIRDSLGAVVGSVSVATTTLECDFDDLLALRPRVMTAAEDISFDYGWRDVCIP